MSENTYGPADPQPSFSAAGLDEWVGHVEAVLRGIAHALNNRASAISAVIELSRDPGEEDVTRSILTTELDRLLELSSVVRSIGSPRSGGSEAFAPRDVAPEALAALQLHAEQRDRVIMIEANAAPPTRVPRWMFLRAMIALAATSASPDDRSRSVRLTAVEEGEWLMVRSVDGGARRSVYAGELAIAMGGAPVEDECAFRVPTLAALRQREGL